MKKKECLDAKGKNVKCKSEAISYRMKCPKTANGLSHFVMYGDIQEKETLL
jgi:hypothetical protein